MPNSVRFTSFCTSPIIEFGNISKTNRNFCILNTIDYNMLRLADFANRVRNFSFDVLANAKLHCDSRHFHGCSRKIANAGDKIQPHNRLLPQFVMLSLRGTAFPRHPNGGRNASTWWSSKTSSRGWDAEERNAIRSQPELRKACTKDPLKIYVRA